MRYQRVKDVAWRRIGGQTVIVNLGRRRMLAVNEAGGAVWEALAGSDPVLPGEAAPFLMDLEAEGVVERRAADEAGLIAAEAAAAVPSDWVPAVVWREELLHLGACAFFPGQNEVCNANASLS